MVSSRKKYLMNDLSLRIIRDTEFIKLYNKVIFETESNYNNKYSFLKLAVMFLNVENDTVNNLGYRMILKYSNKFKDYIPLYDVSINKGFIPVSKFIEDKLLKSISPKESFFYEFIKSFEENFRVNDIYLTEEQYQLNEFFEENNFNNISIVAPTSYGKSELILNTINKNHNKICILVPTKSLLSQTKMRVSHFVDNRKIITHPDMYNESYKNFIAILTQERMLRLLQKNKTISFDFLIVDEAHNLLYKDERAKLLASAIIIAKHRNKQLFVKYLTPFLMEEKNLKTEYCSYDIVNYKIKENIKSENYYYYDFFDNKGIIQYDQYMNKTYQINDKKYNSEIELISDVCSNKNIIYFNKPVNIEDFADKLIETLSPINNHLLTKAIKHIKDYIHEEYKLTKCLERGFVYHHGSVPDNIRLYIEHLFSTFEDLKYLISSSTLLEGVNIPADKIFLLETKKGLSNLSHAQFKNLVGRICRFKDIFNSQNKSLSKLEPEVYLIKSEYMHSNANILSYLKNTVKIDKKQKEIPENVLLNETKIDTNNIDQKEKAVEFLENQETGITNENNIRVSTTKVGKVCFNNSIFEVAIIENEQEMQHKVDEMINNKKIVSHHSEIMNIISNIFIEYVTHNKNTENLIRLKQQRAQNFYSMFLGWKIKQASYGEMIYSFIQYWNLLGDKSKYNKEIPLVYVGKWGDTIRQNEKTGNKGYRKLWTNIAEKSYHKKVNLAIVRIKEEQDFVENNLMKFIEALNDLNLLENDLYNNIKYGTSDMQIITLVKNGVGFQTAKLLIHEYSNFITINTKNSTVKISSQILDVMRQNKENEIVIFEVSCNTDK